MFNKLKKIDLITLFSIIVLGSVLFTIFYNYFVNGTYILNKYRSFLHLEDHTIHIFGLLDKNNYPSYSLVFPPFAYLIYNFFLKSDITINENYNYMNASIDTYHIYYFFAIIQIIFYVIFIFEIFKKESLLKRIGLAFSVVLSYPLYYATLYKGNNVLTVALLLLVAVYLINRQEKKKYDDLIAMALIGVSFGIKIVPAIFGLEFIRKKEYRNAIILAIIGLLIFFIPFWYFDGLETIIKYFSQLGVQNSGNFSKTGIFFYINFIAKKFLNIDFEKKTYLIKIVQLVILSTSLFAYFKTDKNWKRYTALCFLCYNFIPRPHIYYVLYYVVGLVFFLYEENDKLTNCIKEKKYYDIIYCILFSLIFAVYLFHYTEFVHFVFSFLLGVTLFIDICFGDKGMFFLKNNDKCDKVVEKVLYFVYFLHQFVFVFSVSLLSKNVASVNKISNLLIIATFLVIILIDIYYFFRGKFTLNEIFIIGIIAKFILISFMQYKSVMVLVNLVAISCFKNADGKKALDCYIKATVLGFAVLLLISLFTKWTGNAEQTRYGLLRVRQGLGFMWPAFGPHYFYSIVFTYIVLKDKLKVLDYVILMIINVLLFILTDTKAVFAFTILILIIDILIKRSDIIYRVFSYFTIVSFIAFTTVLYLCSKFYNEANIFLSKFNKILTGRLALTNIALEKWGIKLFGQTLGVENHNHGIDSSLISMMIENGLVVFIICVCFMSYFAYISYKTKNKSLVLALFAIALRSTFDLGFMAFQFSPIVIMFYTVLLSYISQYKKVEVKN